MVTANQLKFRFDSSIAQRLRQIEQLADLSPVSWASLTYRGKPGEIAKFRRLKEEIEGNIGRLNKLMGDPQTTKEQFCLARAMRLQLIVQRDRAISVIYAIQKSEEGKG